MFLYDYGLVLSLAGKACARCPSQLHFETWWPNCFATLMCLRLDAKLGQSKLLGSVVLFYGRPFKSQEALLYGWSCQAFRGGVARLLGARCL